MSAFKEAAATKTNASALERILTGESVQILCEIIGCQNLIHPNEKYADKKLNPFVMAKLRDTDGKVKLLRKTKKLNENNNPIWTVEHRCLFLLDATNDRLKSGSKGHSAKLRLEVKHKDSIKVSSCTLLGCTEISLEEILHKCTEERIELSLQQNKKDDIHKKISIRFRVATKVDLAFMGKMREHWKDYSYFVQSNLKEECQNEHLITESSEKYLAYRGVVNRLSFRKKFKDEFGDIKLRVMPYSDPDRPETKYLTHDEMEEEILKPSTNWIECGTATPDSLGTLYLEVLKCDGLPNMDTGEAIGNKTDAFICAMYENSLVQTDVIDDKLSPMWLPWTQRAYIFHMSHALSPLFISTLDYDIGLGGHDGIGRLAINLNHFQSDVVYTLQYALYPASNIPEREMLGTVTIRLRKSIKDHKQLMMTSLKPAPRFNVNMHSHKTLSVANYTSFGKHNEENYDIKLLRSYVNEMLEMKRFFFYALSDAISSLTHWRGQVQVGQMYLPLHSAVAFFGGIYLVERPHLLPGFFFLGIAWMMIANMNIRTHHPDPWNRSLTFTYFFSVLFTGEPPISYTKIDKFEGHEEKVRYELNWKNRIDTDLDAANRAWELQEEMNKVGNEELHTAEEKVEHDPVAIAMNSLASRLFPMQKRLRGYCEIMRKMRLILVWQENLLSFWITLSCILLGCTLLVLPTMFLIQWACRLLIWVGLGPWIRLYNECLSLEKRSPLALNDEEARSRYSESIYDKLTSQFQEKLDEARLTGEEAIKLKAMRVCRFGRYISKVPSMNITRHYDVPLSGSSALHYDLFDPTDGLAEPKGNIRRRRIPSSTLNGLMIPYTQEQMKDIFQNEKTEKENQLGTSSVSISHEVDASLSSITNESNDSDIKDSETTKESKQRRVDNENTHQSIIVPHAKGIFDNALERFSHLGFNSASRNESFLHSKLLHNGNKNSLHSEHEDEPLIQKTTRDKGGMIIAWEESTTSKSKVEIDLNETREPSQVEVRYCDERDVCDEDNIEVTLSSSMYDENRQ